MELPATFAIAALTSILYCLFFWSASLKYKKTWLVDIAWSSGFFIIYLVCLLINSNFSFKHSLVLLMLFLWGLRLSIYLFARNFSKSENFEYQKLKDKWGKKMFSNTPLLVTLWQAGSLLVVCSPAIMLSTYKEITQIELYDIIFSLVWLAGFLLESFADLQLFTFKSNPANHGRILKEGLWKYSRHPNYLGEALMWSAIFFIVLPVPGAIYTVVSPIFLIISLLTSTGAGIVEAKLSSNPEYPDYINSTNKIFPNPKEILKTRFPKKFSD